MNRSTSIADAAHVDETLLGKHYADLLNQVASGGQPIVLQRQGSDLGALVSMQHLEVLLDWLARQEALAIASHIDWKQKVKASPPAQQWFEEEEPKPF